MRCAPLLVVFVSVLSCKPSVPAAYPDRDQVTLANKKWCDMLAEANGAKGSWMHQADCEASYPTSSAAFLSRLTECYRKELAEYGDDAPDSGALIAGCTQDVLVAAEPGDVSATELFKARCGRMNRCQQVTPEVCVGAFERLDGMSRAMLTSMYNLRAQGEIAACLGDGDCGEDEDRAQHDCYSKASDRRLWLPLSLAHDPGITPDP